MVRRIAAARWQTVMAVPRWVDVAGAGEGLGAAAWY